MQPAEYTIPQLNVAQAAIDAVFTALGEDAGRYLTLLTRQYYNIVCMVAYVIRCRGHHYMDSYDEIYDRLWEKCAQDMNGDLRTATWQHTATIGLHAIPLSVLEFFWVTVAELGE